MIGTGATLRAMRARLAYLKRWALYFHYYCEPGSAPGLGLSRGMHERFDIPPLVDRRTGVQYLAGRRCYASTEPCHVLENSIISIQAMEGCAGAWSIPLVYVQGRGYTSEPQMSAAKVAMLFGKPMDGRSIKPARSLRGDYFHLLGPYHSNWYHTLIDQFSLIARWEREGLRHRGVKLVLPELWAYRWPDLARLADLEDHDILWLGSEALEVERLWLPVNVRMKSAGLGVTSRIAQTFASPQDVRGLRVFLERFLRRPESQAPRYRRILIDRSDSTRDARTQYFSDLSEVLIANHGFQRLVLSRLSPIEQLQFFSESEIIVAEHGAGLSSIVVARNDAKIVEILPTNAAAIGAHGFNAIAAILGFKHYHTLVDASVAKLMNYLQQNILQL